MSIIEQLIEEIKKYPFLWDKNINEYRNQTVRDDAWERISTELDRPGKYIFYFVFIVNHKKENKIK